MDWWIWLIGAIVLCVVEAATPGGFIFIFFGIAAFIVGGAVALGFLETIAAQGIAFSLLSVGALLAFRRPLQRLIGKNHAADAIDSMVGASAVALDDIPAGGVGKAELRGTPWSARNNGKVAVHKGQRCRVERVDDLTLFLVPE